MAEPTTLSHGPWEALATLKPRDQPGGWFTEAQEGPWSLGSTSACHYQALESQAVQRAGSEATYYPSVGQSLPVAAVQGRLKDPAEFEENVPRKLNMPLGSLPSVPTLGQVTWLGNLDL